MQVSVESTSSIERRMTIGVPAKKVKTLSPELFKGEVQRIANNYIEYASWFKE